MKERPILFSGAMVRAILEGRKTQTRRVVKPQPPHGPFPCPYSRTGWAMASPPAGAHSHQGCTCAPLLPDYGQPGDRLWVRETWAVHSWREHQPARETRKYHEDGEGHCLWYAADGLCAGGCDEHQRGRWRPSIHMPRWASRLTLEVTGVRVERVQEITEPDAIAEGTTHYDCGHPDCADGHYGPRGAFFDSWDKINAKRGYGWDANPWVWVVEFKRV